MAATIAFTDDDAERYGIPAACVLYIIRTDPKYATVECMAERLWFISVPTIRRSISHLLEDGVLLWSQPWTKKMNHTKIYAIKEASK